MALLVFGLVALLGAPSVGGLELVSKDTSALSSEWLDFSGPTDNLVKEVGNYDDGNIWQKAWMRVFNLNMLSTLFFLSLPLSSSRKRRSPVSPSICLPRTLSSCSTLWAARSLSSIMKCARSMPQ